MRSGTAIEAVLERYRQVVPKLESDRIISKDMERTRIFLKDGISLPGSLRLRS
jgi:histidine ammonia-lyase